MEKLIVLLFCFLSLSVGCYVWYFVGYRAGQTDALQGIYKLTQERRDLLDPKGLHHHIER